jgi:hypothetical protein
VVLGELSRKNGAERKATAVVGIVLYNKYMDKKDAEKKLSKTRR